MPTCVTDVDAFMDLNHSIGNLSAILILWSCHSLIVWRKVILFGPMNLRASNLIRKMMNALIPILPNFDKIFEVDCDASYEGIGAILNQEGCPIVFFNKQLNASRLNYSIVLCGRSSPQMLETLFHSKGVRVKFWLWGFALSQVSTQLEPVPCQVVQFPTTIYIQT